MYVLTIVLHLIFVNTFSKKRLCFFYEFYKEKMPYPASPDGAVEYGIWVLEGTVRESVDSAVLCPVTDESQVKSSRFFFSSII